jgi:TonB family protein
MASGSPLQAFQGNTAFGAVPREIVPGGASLIVLTRDEALVHTLRAMGPEYAISAVSAESDFATHLLSHSTGVAILDASAVASSVERLSERLRAQFPDLVLIVAGSVDDQSALATQITNGTIYRFLHKPVSDQRVKLFVDAAWRRHSEELAGGTSVANANSPARTAPGAGSNVLVLGGVVLAAAVIIGGWSVLHKSNSVARRNAAVEPSETVAPATPRDAVLEDQLARADKALASGALVAPSGANAADLYRQALQRNPKEPRAVNGLEQVIDRLLSTAEAQLLAQHLDEAQKLTDQARAIKPEHVRVAFLMAQIGKERERAVLAQARQAASSGNIEQALSVLDTASRDGSHTPLMTQARQELEQKKLEERVRQYVNLANDRMRSGQLVEPAEDNAQFYIESARALAPNDTEVKQIQKQFLERLVSDASKLLASGNADQAQQAIKVAADAGVSQDDIDALNQEMEHVRATAKADALAHLALLFNQRLTQGKVLEPLGDSAKSYLAELEQAGPAHQATEAARQAFAARLLDEAKNAAHREDYAGAQHWLAEARQAGVDAASINAVNNDIKTAQDAAAAASRANEVVSAASLEITHYVPPEFPFAARERAMGGWVDLQFMVMMDGSVGDISVVAADPAGVFEAPATEAVRKWKYQPILRDGKPINQRASVRVRFALQK